MKMKFLLGLVLALSPVAAFAQKDVQALKDADKVLYKIARLNIVKFIAPLLLKKTQINDLLNTIEKCRAKELDIREKDAVELKKLEEKVDKALEQAINDGSYPKRELQTEIIKVQDALLIRRRIATNEMVDMLFETCKKSLNEGQMSNMKNLVDPQNIDPSFKLDKLTDDDKIKLFIRQIFLDGLAYDILKDLAKRAQ